MPCEPGTNGEIPLVSLDASEPIVQAMREGDMAGTVMQDPYRMGYLAVWKVVMHLEGYDVSAEGKDPGTGEYVVTKDNLDAEATRVVRSGLAGETNAQDPRRQEEVRFVLEIPCRREKP